MWLKYIGIYFGITMILFLTTEMYGKEGGTIEGSVISKYDSQVLKGLAIYCVVLCHFMGTFGEGITLFTPLGGIGVSIFLFLSAYGLNKSYMSGGGVFALVA